MKSKIYKINLLTLMALLVLNIAGFAQSSPRPPANAGKQTSDIIQLKIDDLSLNMKVDLDGVVKTIVRRASEIAPKINLELKDISLDLENIVPNIDLALKEPDGTDNENTDGFENSVDSHAVKEKSKTYSKSYPVDGNDKIKLSSQYGKIIVSTWDRHEIKVDVLIKAQATDDVEAQKLLNSVQIYDSKNGDIVYYRTEIERNNGGSWKLWNWGNNNKTRKLEIDYNVYMPAKKRPEC